MPSRVRVKWNLRGLYAIRRAPGVVTVEERRVRAIADRCNRAAGLADGYRVSSQQGASRPQGRHRTTVITATYEAMRDNARHNRLVKELHG